MSEPFEFDVAYDTSFEKIEALRSKYLPCTHDANADNPR